MRGAARRTVLQLKATIFRLISVSVLKIISYNLRVTSHFKANITLICSYNTLKVVDIKIVSPFDNTHRQAFIYKIKMMSF